MGAQAAMDRYLTISTGPVIDAESKEEKEEKEEQSGTAADDDDGSGHPTANTSDPASCTLFPLSVTPQPPDSNQMSDVNIARLLSVESSDTVDNSSPVSPLSPAVSGPDSDR